MDSEIMNSNAQRGRPRRLCRSPRSQRAPRGDRCYFGLSRVKVSRSTIFYTIVADRCMHVAILDKIERAETRRRLEADAEKQWGVDWRSRPQPTPIRL